MKLIKTFILISLLSVQQIRADFEGPILSSEQMVKALHEEEENLSRLESKLFRTQLYEKTMTTGSVISAIALAYRLKNTYNMKMVLSDNLDVKEKLSKLRHELSVQKNMIVSKTILTSKKGVEKIKAFEAEPLWSAEGNAHIQNFRKDFFSSLMINSILLTVSGFIAMNTSGDAILGSDEVNQIKDAIHAAKTNVTILKQSLSIPPQ